nr:unnamed protein product [Callosobruchus chinensis]
MRIFVHQIHHISQQDFYSLASFPRIIGAIDYTLNRKGDVSINTQMMCDAKFKILNVVARWPASTHDSTIFNNK